LSERFADDSKQFAASSFACRSASPCVTVDTDHLSQAAIDRQGLTLGRYPLVKQYLENGSLVAPLEGRSQTSRAYFLIEARKKVRGAEYLVEWLLKETTVS
jgi:hypothetical protein